MPYAENSYNKTKTFTELVVPQTLNELYSSSSLQSIPSATQSNYSQLSSNQVQKSTTEISSIPPLQDFKQVIC